jgi:hypothetical protein
MKEGRHDDFRSSHKKVTTEGKCCNEEDCRNNFKKIRTDHNEYIPEEHMAACKAAICIIYTTGSSFCKGLNHDRDDTGA